MGTGDILTKARTSVVRGGAELIEAVRAPVQGPARATGWFTVPESHVECGPLGRRGKHPGKIRLDHPAGGTVSGRAIARVALVVGILAAGAWRLDYVLSAPIRWWPDSAGYSQTGSQPIWSHGFWTGSRPPLTGLVWHFTSTSVSFAVAQTLVSAAAWAFLAWSVAANVDAPWRRLAASLPILGFSLSPLVLQWDASVLSESLALSSVASAIACAIWLAHRFTWIRASGLLLSLLLFALDRDEAVPIIVVIASAFLVCAPGFAIARSGRRALRVAAIGCLLIAVSAGCELAATASHRNVANVENLLFVRVFPYPDRVAWFADHGMPQAAQINQAADQLRSDHVPGGVLPVSFLDTKASVVYLLATQKKWRPLSRWMASEGESTYALYLITHPDFSMRAPLKEPQMSFLSPPLAFYWAGGHKAIPGLAILDLTNGSDIAVTMVIALGVITIRRLYRDRAVILTMLLLPTGGFGMFVAWHGDGIETARHALEGNVIIRLSAVMLVTFALLLPAGKGRSANGESDRLISEMP